MTKVAMTNVYMYVSQAEANMKREEKMRKTLKTKRMENKLNLTYRLYNNSDWESLNVQGPQALQGLCSFLLYETHQRLHGHTNLHHANSRNHPQPTLKSLHIYLYLVKSNFNS